MISVHSGIRKAEPALAVKGRRLSRTAGDMDRFSCKTDQWRPAGIPQSWEFGRVKWHDLCVFIYNLRETASISQLGYFSPPSYFPVCHLSWLLHLTQTSLTDTEKAVGQDKGDEGPSSQTGAGTVERRARGSDKGKLRAAASTKATSDS